MFLSWARSIQSMPPPTIPLLEDPFKYYPPICAYVFQAFSFPKVSRRKPLIHFSSPRYVLHSLSVSEAINS
jgi:hypothetical protein